MSKKTVNYNLIKPESNDNYDIEDQNNNMDIIDSELKAINDFRDEVIKFPKASGTGVLITVTTGLFKLEDGNTVTFIASADNAGQITTLNVDGKGAKPIYKPGTVVAPSIKTGKAITVWYDLEHECFFIKASAEGNATAENVLAGDIFSNDDDTGLVGSMPNIGNVGALDLNNQGQAYEIPKGYHDGQGKVKAAITNLSSSVIKSGSTVGGVQGDFTSDASAQASHMLAGVTAYVNGSKITGTIPSKVAEVYTPSTVNQSISAGKYLAGDQTIAGDSGLVSSNIKAGANIFGVAGNANVVDTSAGTAASGHILSGQKAYVDGALVTGTIPSIGAQTITPSTVNKSISAGNYLSGTQTIAGDGDLVSANIKAGVNIFGVAGNANVVDTSAGTAAPGHILSGQKAYVDGALVTGTIPSIAAKTYTPSTVNQAIPAGYYLSGAQTIAGDADLIASNIRKGINIHNVVGTYLMPAPVSGTNLIAKLSSDRTVMGTTPVKVKSVQLNIAGTYTISFTLDMSRDTNNCRAIGQLYSGDVPVGTEQWVCPNSTQKNPMAFSQNITVSEPTTIDLYIWQDGTSTSLQYYSAIARDFTIGIGNMGHATPIMN